VAVGCSRLEARDADHKEELDEYRDLLKQVQSAKWPLGPA